MRYYELLYIVNPNLEDDRVKNIINEISNEINKYKVSIINHYLWGKKRLAYPINKNKYGIYLLLHFGAEQFDFLKDFERFLILDKSVIRHQLVRLDDKPTKVEEIEPVVADKDSLKDEGSDIPNDDTNVYPEKMEKTEEEKGAEKTGDVKDVKKVDDSGLEESEGEKEIKAEKKEEDE